MKKYNSNSEQFLIILNDLNKIDVNTYPNDFKKKFCTKAERAQVCQGTIVHRDQGQKNFEFMLCAITLKHSRQKS